MIEFVYMYIKLYLIAVLVFFAIDMVWLGLVARNFYAQQIGFLLKSDVNWVAAIIFYLLFVLGLVVFVIGPNMQESLVKMFLMGVFFGVVTYATYDLTNLATIKNWPLLVTVVDLVWGGFLSGSVALLTMVFAKRIGL